MGTCWAFLKLVWFSGTYKNLTDLDCRKESMLSTFIWSRKTVLSSIRTRRMGQYIDDEDYWLAMPLTRRSGPLLKILQSSQWLGIREHPPEYPRACISVPLSWQCKTVASFSRIMLVSEGNEGQDRHSSHKASPKLKKNTVGKVVCTLFLNPYVNYT